MTLRTAKRKQRFPVTKDERQSLPGNDFWSVEIAESRARRYVLSICRYFMSIEWIVVKMFVAPWTMLSRVSGRTTGVQEAKKTNSLRLQTGTNGRK